MITVEEREAEYRIAVGAHDLALQRLSLAEQRWFDAAEEFAAARAAGDQERAEQARARAQPLALELQSARRRAEDTAEAVDSARIALMEAIDARLDSLVAQMEETTEPDERQALAIRIADLNNQYNELEREGEEPLVPQFANLPEILFDPRDGPAELRLKAEMADQRAAQANAFMEEADRQISELQERLRRNRDLQDLLAGIERFGDIQTPVGVRTRRTTEQEGVEAQADTLAAAEPLTLEERIEQLESLREQAEEYRDQMRALAERFRRRIGGVRT